MKIQRLCIYTKDIMIVTGKSERYSRKILQEIKQQLGKKPNQFVTIKEFSEFSGLNELDIKKIIQD